MFHIPISTSLNEANDSGSPLCSDNPHSSVEEELGTFSKLADALSTDLLLLQHGSTPLSLRRGNESENGKTVLTVMIDEAGDLVFDVPFTQLSIDNEHKQFTVRLFSNDGGYQKNISGRDLRIREPRTGDAEEHNIHEAATIRSGCGGQSMVQHHSASNDSSSADTLFPARITKKGNYGYEVEWADGATIIYSLLAIARSAGGKPSQ